MCVISAKKFYFIFFIMNLEWYFFKKKKKCTKGNMYAWYSQSLNSSDLFSLDSSKFFLVDFVFLTSKADIL